MKNVMFNIVKEEEKIEQRDESKIKEDIVKNLYNVEYIGKNSNLNEEKIKANIKIENIVKFLQDAPIFKIKMGTTLVMNLGESEEYKDILKETYVDIKEEIQSEEEKRCLEEIFDEDGFNFLEDYETLIIMDLINETVYLKNIDVEEKNEISRDWFDDGFFLRNQKSFDEFVGEKISDKMEYSFLSNKDTSIFYLVDIKEVYPLLVTKKVVKKYRYLQKLNLKEGDIYLITDLDMDGVPINSSKRASLHHLILTRILDDERFYK